MLKSTHKPSANAPSPLPPGWTEHKAPTGHTYYYNQNTKESTYKRPSANQQPPHPPPQAHSNSFQSPYPQQNAHQSHFQYSSVPNLSDPAAANAFLAQYDPARQRQAESQRGRGGHRGGSRGGHDGRPRPQPVDKPRSKVPIPGHEPWILVYTKYGRRFAYNPTKNASYWRIPEKIMQGVLELDINGIKGKAEGDQGKVDTDEPHGGATAAEGSRGAPEGEEEPEQEQEIGSDYEEVEVTDDEGEEGHDEENEEGNPSKRQRTEEPGAEMEDTDMPVEFNEEDIAFQLQAMGQEYGLDPGEYDDGDLEAWPEGAEGIILSDDDARELFKDLLGDFRINPYSSWDKLVEEGKLVDDPRYTALPNMKARRDVWEDWSRERIQVLKEQRAREATRDPRIPFLGFLQDRANPKLYWAEFRRKHRKEDAMRDSSLNDRDREKLYRDHVARLRLPLDTRKKDLTALLRSIPPSKLNASTSPDALPSAALSDLRYISLPPEVRDPLIETYIGTLPPPPSDESVQEDEAAQKAKQDRMKREKALAERERVVAEEKRRQRRQLEHGRAALREEERELERADHVGKKGLQSQLATMAVDDK